MTATRGPSMLLYFGMTLGFLSPLAPQSAVHAEVDISAARPHGGEPVQPLAKRLQTHDQAELIMLLDELAPSPEAERDSRAIALLLQVGQTDVVADHALDALARLRAREAREVLITFAHHRRPEARQRAYVALAHIADTRDIGVLSQGLRDSSPQVRSEVARLLAAHTAPTSAAERAKLVADLMSALELGVNDAAAAIGKLGDTASVERFTAYVGRLPLPVLLDGYAKYLERADVPDASKLRIVATLEEVSGGVVKDFLLAWLERPEHRANTPLRQAVTAASARVLRPDTTSGVQR